MGLNKARTRQLVVSEKLSGLVSEFGRLCGRRKLRVNVGNGQVMSCCSYVNVGRMSVRLNV